MNLVENFFKMKGKNILKYVGCSGSSKIWKENTMRRHSAVHEFYFVKL